jgi:hypothetical protein
MSRSQANYHTARLSPVAYTSRKLTSTQQGYSAQEREMLAVIQALQTWRYWLEDVEIIVHTDHESLAGVRTKKDLL